MAFSFTRLEITTDAEWRKTSDVMRSLKEEIITDHQEDILKTVEQQYGSREVRFVFGLAPVEIITPSKHDISPILSLSIQNRLQELESIAYVQTLESALAELYALPIGSCDVEQGCKATWKQSKIPLHVEVCYHFENDDSNWSFNVPMDGIEDHTDLSKTAMLGLQFVKDIRAVYEEQIESNARSMMGTWIAPEKSKAEGLESMRAISIGQRREAVKKLTEINFKELLALKDDPLDDYVLWWKRIQDLASGVNMVDADPSLFENLDDMIDPRHETWLKRMKNRKKRQEQRMRRRQRASSDNHTATADQPANDTANADQPATDTVGADETTNGTADTDQPDHDTADATKTDDAAGASHLGETTNAAQSENTPDAHQPSEDAADAEQLEDVSADEMADPEESTSPPADDCETGTVSAGNGSPDSENTLTEQLENLPPLTPVTRSTSHPGGSNFPPGSASSAPTQVQSSDELEDMSDDEAMLEPPDEVSTPKRSSTPRPGAYQTWAIDGAWFYCENQYMCDNALFRTGLPAHYYPPPLLPALHERPQNPLPVFVRRGRVTGRFPKIEYDPVWNRNLVTPHTEVIPRDLRSMMDHPDWLPRWKLQEYQAVETASVEVWRCDRAKLKCTMPDCEHMCSDSYDSTQLCLGCGPSSSVRYCSKEHLRQDLEGHWEECGHPEFVLPYWVDKGTQPAKFERRYPAIRDANNWVSFEKLRQRLYYIWNRGQYTIFYGDGRGPTVVTWPTVELQNKYGPRVERCMNAAFYDQDLQAVIEHLYYLVRMALRLSGQWRSSTRKRIKKQLTDEFGLDAANAHGEDPCECAWTGIEANTDQCTPDCVEVHARLNIDEPRAGMKAILENLEAKSWLLRVWQRQHPTITNWRIRLTGAGFPGARVHDLDRERPLMGRLWDGFGAPDVCDGWEDIF